MYWIGKTKVIPMSFRTYLRQVHMTFIRNIECLASVTEMKTKIEKKKILSQKVANLLLFSAYCTHLYGIYYFRFQSHNKRKIGSWKPFAIVIDCTMENCSRIIMTSFTSYTWSFHTYSMHKSQNTGKLT